MIICDEIWSRLSECFSKRKNISNYIDNTFIFKEIQFDEVIAKYLFVQFTQK